MEVDPKGNQTLPINVESFGLIYPIKFNSPLPLAECKNRLQQSFGKAMGSLFTTIEGEVEMMDATTCKFRVYQFVAKGGMRTIIGYLYAQPDSTTVVDAVFGLDRSPRTGSPDRFASMVMIIAVSAVILFILQQFVCAAITLVVLAWAFYIERRIRLNPPQMPRPFKKEPPSQLLWWFERTLKDKNYLPL